MIKWYDDIEKQIKEIQDEVDGIEAGEVDAKNLSEVLDKDAPINLTTDLQNNKVKVGLYIDSDTLEVDNGKLKVKQASGGKKHLHRIRLTFKPNKIAELSQYTNFNCYFTLVTNNAEPFTKQTLQQYMMADSYLNANYEDFLGKIAFNNTTKSFIMPKRLGASNYNGANINIQIYIYTFGETLTENVKSYACLVSEGDSYWEVLDKVTEL